MENDRSVTPPGRLRARRLVGVTVLISVFGAATYSVSRFVVRHTSPTVSTAPAPATHPLTGRQLAGLATDTKWLDRAVREQEEQPDRALELIGIRPGMAVADIGAGTGYMTARIARLVGPSGTVYASDVQSTMVRILEDRTREQGLTNVKVIQGTSEDAHLPEQMIDLALLVDVYHEFSRPQQMLQSIHQALKTDGRLVLIEYRREDPTIPIPETHKMSVADARTEVEAEGFKFDRLVPDLPRQHIIVFQK